MGRCGMMSHYFVRVMVVYVAFFPNIPSRHGLAITCAVCNALRPTPGVIAHPKRLSMHARTPKYQ